MKSKNSVVDLPANLNVNQTEIFANDFTLYYVYVHIGLTLMEHGVQGVLKAGATPKREYKKTVSNTLQFLKIASAEVVSKYTESQKQEFAEKAKGLERFLDLLMGENVNLAYQTMDVLQHHSPDEPLVSTWTEKESSDYVNMTNPNLELTTKPTKEQFALFAHEFESFSGKGHSGREIVEKIREKWFPEEIREEPLGYFVSVGAWTGFARFDAVLDSWFLQIENQQTKDRKEIPNLISFIMVKSRFSQYTKTKGNDWTPIFSRGELATLLAGAMKDLFTDV